ncbi:MAG: hypothetical protein KDK91_10530 [Gammaproteobacteria bacterium]|nr:hypothetical protein [Gammaproteobacteria bacterium]
MNIEREPRLELAADLADLQVEAFTLAERFNAHCELEVSAWSTSPAHELTALAGTQTILTVAPAGHRVDLFRGDIVDVSCNPEATGWRFSLLARSSSARHDRAPRCQIFSTHPDTAVALAEMPDFAALLRRLAVRAEDAALNVAVDALVQDRETDWAFLVRIAAALGARVRTDATESTVVLEMPGAALDPLHLAEQDIITGRLEAHDGLVAACAHRWQRRTGHIDGDVRVGGERAPGRALPSNSFIPTLDPMPTLARRHAAAWVAAQGDGTPRWHGTLRHLGPSLGAAVQLPGPWDIDSPLIVTRRVIRFTTQADTDPLSTEVSLEPPMAAGRCAELPPNSATVWLGQVLDAPSSPRRGEIAVRFPGSEDIDGQTAWCDTLHAFAGVDADGGTHGTWMVPKAYDWVLVLVSPASSARPVVLGALYKGEHDLEGVTGSDRAQRVIYAAGGLRLAMNTPERLVQLSAEASKGAALGELTLTREGELMVKAERGLGFLAGESGLRIDQDVVRSEVRMKVSGGLEVNDE